MEKRKIYSSYAPAPVGPYSQAVKAGNLLFLSGQIPMNAETSEVVAGPFEKQVRTVLNNIQTILEEGGSSIDKVLKVTIFLTDMNNFAELNAIYDEYFGESRPARSCVEVRRLPKDVSLEIEAIASCD